MRSHIVLIDFENVQPVSLESLLPEHFRVLLFVGATQAKLPFEIVASMQKFGGRAEYVKIDGNGSNALDFHIAYYIGILSAAEPTAYFYIVSKDGGFDPLIKHLNTKHVIARRVKSINEIPLGKLTSSKATPATSKRVVSEIPLGKGTCTKSLEERVQLVRDKLARPKVSKPRTLKTLRRSIASFFQNQLSDEELSETVTGLISQGFVSVDKTKIVYAPASEGGVEASPEASQ